MTPKVAPPSLRTDYFATAMERVRESNALVETLYQIDRDGGFSPYGKPEPRAHAFATDRLAAGSALLRDLWWSAWVNSAKRRER